MKWYGISGSWRLTSQKVESDVRTAVKEIIKSGDGIVTGGALNVDYFATDQVMKMNPGLKQIKIFLPSTLDVFSEHYRKRALEGVITSDQAENLISQLGKIKKVNPDALIEDQKNKILNKETYYNRNTAVINASDILLAFQVNDSSGVQDTIDKAKSKGIPVRVKSYHL